MLVLDMVEGNAMAETVNFDDAATGAAPKGWTLTMTGRGQPRWTIEAEATAPSKPNVLKQSGQATFSVALKNGTSIRDGFIEVQFNAIAGSEDRAAGLAWRAKDADNYYVVRANALEDNVVLYKTIKGCSQCARYRRPERRLWRRGSGAIRSMAYATLRIRGNAIQGDV